MHETILASLRFHRPLVHVNFFNLFTRSSVMSAVVVAREGTPPAG